MANFELIEFQFDPDDFSLSLEDEFLLTRLTTEIESVNSAVVLKEAALSLLKLSVQRQAVIRALVRRLADLEMGAIKKIYTE